MLLDAQGRPIAPRAPTQEAAAVRATQLPGANPGLGDLWSQPTGLQQADAAVWTSLAGSPGSLASRYGISRDNARRLTRTLYFTNAIFGAAVRLVGAFLVGDALSYGRVADRAVNQVLEEFWQTNAFGEYVTQRFITEFLLDGEVGMVWPTGDQARPEVASRVAALDLGLHVRVDGSTSRGLVAADMVERLVLHPGTPREQRWEDGEMVWLAYDGLWNDVRGWPPALGAAMAAIGYIGLINSRLNTHAIHSRLLAIYKAFLDPGGMDASGQPDGGLSAWRAKAGAFRNIPQDGTVVPLVVKPGHTDHLGNRYDGVSESLEFPTPSPGAASAEADGRMLLRLIGVTFGLPEHFLGEGGNATRTTASEMTLPAVMIARRLQAYVRGFMDRVVRTELARRHGPDRLYTVYTVETDESGLKRKRKRRRVPAALIEIPWVLPTIDHHTLEELLRKAEAAERHGWASPQTNAASLGYDPAAEEELLAAVGRTFGNAPTPPAPTPGGDPNVPPSGDPDAAPPDPAGTGPG